MPLREWVALQEVLFAKPLMAHNLLARCGSVEAIFHATADDLQLTAAEWNAVRQFRESVDWQRVDTTLEWCERHHIAIVTMIDPAYPVHLATCPDCPPVLYIDGDVAVLAHAPSVAIVGSRKATRYGEEMAERIATGLAAAGATVVSGLATGIDGIAHRAAVTAGGRSIGVLGSGLDRFYPPQHQDLARQMRVAGAVVTEFPPCVAAFPHHFPQRNRVISGLAMAVVVVEAAEKSGSLITARFAGEQGRLLFAVPGCSGHVTTRGTHNLLREGAQLAESAEDILEAIRPLSTQTCQSMADDAIGAALLPLLTEARVLDQLIAGSGRPAADVLARLSQWECEGRVRVLPGNRYVRIDSWQKR